MQEKVKPNVRTYTALITALGNAKQWKRAMATLHAMKNDKSGTYVEPNAYTFSALLKSLGEHGQWGIAERVSLTLSPFQEAALAPAPESPGYICIFHLRTSISPFSDPLQLYKFLHLMVQLFTELEKEALDEIEPEEMFSMDTASGDRSAATSVTFEQTHPASSSTSAAPQHPAYAGWGSAGVASFGEESAAQHASSAGGAAGMPPEVLRQGMQLPSSRRNSTDSNSSYGDMPTAMAEQVGVLDLSSLGLCSFQDPVSLHCPLVNRNRGEQVCCMRR